MKTPTVALAVAVLCIACTNESGTEFPIEPGTGGSAAGASQGSNTGLLRGRVCVLSDIRFQSRCATTDAAGLTVILGSQSTTTITDGSFTLTPPVGTGLSFTASGPGIVTTSQALNARMRINAIRQSAFDAMLLTTGIVPVVGTGSIISSVMGESGTPLSGVTGTSAPAGSFGPFFDGTDPMPWTTNSTGVSGIVWFPGLVAGPAELSFNTLSGGEAIVGGVQVVNGGITMVETPLP
jgi:hypothetical protein